MRYMASGKEVLRNFRHFADCIDSGAAQMIVDALNAADHGTWVFATGDKDVIKGTEGRRFTPLTQVQRDLPLADDGPLFNPQPGDEFTIDVDGKRYEGRFPNCPDTHSVRQQNDEYACSCGKRWDVADGEDHP